MKDLWNKLVDIVEPYLYQKNNYGVTHLLISMAVMIPIAVLFQSVILSCLVGAGLSIYFALKELKGVGNLWGYPDTYNGRFSDWDRRMDWILPLIGNLIVCLVVYYV